MNYLNLFFTKTFYTCLMCTVSGFIVFKTRFNRAFRFICGIIITTSVLTITLPLIAAIMNLSNHDIIKPPETKPEDSITDDTLIAETVTLICEKTGILISQRFSIPKESIKVSITVNNDNKNEIIFKNILVILPNEYMNVYGSISEFISYSLGIPCTVLPEN